MQPVLLTTQRGLPDCSCTLGGVGYNTAGTGQSGCAIPAIQNKALLRCLQAWAWPRTLVSISLYQAALLGLWFQGICKAPSAAPRLVLLAPTMLLTFPVTYSGRKPTLACPLPAQDAGHPVRVPDPSHAQPRSPHSRVGLVCPLPSCPLDCNTPASLCSAQVSFTDILHLPGLASLLAEALLHPRFSRRQPRTPIPQPGHCIPVLRDTYEPLAQLLALSPARQHVRGAGPSASLAISARALSDARQPTTHSPCTSPSRCKPPSFYPHKSLHGPSLLFLRPAQSLRMSR